MTLISYVLEENVNLLSITLLGTKGFSPFDFCLVNYQLLKVVNFPMFVVEFSNNIILFEFIINDIILS